MSQQTTRSGANVPEGATDADLYLENLKGENAGLAARLADLEVGAARLPATIDEDNEAAVTDFAKQLQQAIKEAEKTRKDTKEPWLDRTRTIDDYFRLITDPVRTALSDLKDRLKDYRVEKEKVERERQERIRRDAEEAERKARQEAEQRQAEAERMARQADTAQGRADARRQFDESKAAKKQADQAAERAEHTRRQEREPVQTRGQTGAAGFSKRRWVASVFDYDSVPLEDLRPYLKTEHIDYALRQMISAAEDPSKLDLPGVSFKQAESFQVR